MTPFRKIQVVNRSQVTYMVPRLYSIGLFFSFLLGYMEWGNHSEFVWAMEYQILFGKAGTADTFMHPLIFAPAIGQLLLLYTAISVKPRLSWILTGLILLSLLVLMILLAGLLSLNLRMIASTVPFILLAGLFLRNYKRFGLRASSN